MVACALRRRSSVSAFTGCHGLGQLKIDYHKGEAGEVWSGGQFKFFRANRWSCIAISLRLLVVSKWGDHETTTGRAAAARCHARRQRLHGSLHLVDLEHVLARAHLPWQ